MWADDVQPFPQRRQVLSVGKFEHKKGQDVLIKAFARLAEEHADLDLVLIGAADAALPALRQLVAQEGLHERVMFLVDMPHAEIAVWYQRANLFVLPSRHEPFGIVLLEAGSFGLPVIASNVGGVPEVLIDGVTGHLVEAEQVGELADAIRNVLAEPSVAAEMGEKLRQSVVSQFSWTDAHEKYLHLIS